MSLFVYLYLFLFVIFDIIVLVIGIEQLICFTKNMAPEVPSSSKLRTSVVKQIPIEFPNVKTIVDIGSGWGGMARLIAKSNPDAKVIGLEIMPSPFVYSKIRGVFIKNLKFVFGNAFKYFAKSDEKFDVGIAYLLTPEMKNVENFLSRFAVLFALDFPLPDIEPAKKIKLHRDSFGQHYLYVYKSGK